MAYSTVSTTGFPGLDLTASADEVGCVDLLNVDFDKGGAVRSRDGFDNFTSSAAADRYWACAPYYTASGTKQLLTIRGTTIQALNTSGASVATASTTTQRDQAAFVRFAAPGSELTYIAVMATASGGSNLWKWNGSAFSTVSPSNLSSPALIGLSPVDNRLAAFDSAVGYSRIRFSNAGDPETFGANNYVDLHPGDGDWVRAMATWRELLIVFKEQKYFVFYGNSVDSGGEPVFNYRPISTGAGCLGSRAFARAPEGVYFVGRDGVYITTGGVPQRISDVIEPIFTGAGISSFFGGSALNQAQTALVAATYLNGRLFVAYPSGSATANDRMLVYDTRTERWTVWNVPAAALASLRIGDNPELVFAYASGSNHIGRHSSSYTTDDGSAIVSRYRTGFSNLGDDDEKSIAQAELWGVGTVDYQLSKDFGSLDTASSAAMGSSPAVARARRIQRGGEPATLFSWQVGASSGQWTLHRAVHRVHANKSPGSKTP